MRKINNLDAIESFGNAFITVARYSDTGWNSDKIFLDRNNAVERIKELVNDEGFGEDEVGIRTISTLKIEDMVYENIKDRVWFNTLEE